MAIDSGTWVARDEPLPKHTKFQLRVSGKSSQLIELGPKPLLIGSAPDSDVVIADDREVSGNHARLRRVENGFEITDLQSRNGTYFIGAGAKRGGSPITGTARWLPGVSVRVGRTELSLEIVPDVVDRGADFHGIVGRSKAMLNAYDRVEVLGPFDMPVVIHGETGSGKDLFARAIHRCSPRRNGPYVPLNCAALPADRVEAELFGWLKGSFTGALSDNAGAFGAADGGTLFLDEIGELALEIQAKLLRALQGEIKPLGAVQPRRVDVRVVVASHRSLPDLVRKGRFREDLFYRLGGAKLELPSLMERREDIPQLVERFRRALPIPSLPTFGREAMKKLERYSWPGNVRELQSVVVLALANAAGRKRGEVLAEDVELNEEPIRAPGEFDPYAIHKLDGMTMDDIEAYAMRAAEIRCDGNKTLAAEKLGIARNRMKGAK